MIQKLVRDALSLRPYAKGLKKLSDEEFEKALKEKLLEESQELQEAETPEDLLSELSDVYEVLETLMRLKNITPETLQAIQEDKREKRGGFEERLYVESIDLPEDHPFTDYCRKSPHKYPEK